MKSTPGDYYGITPARKFRQVDRFEPTSKACSDFGFYYGQLTLGVRGWDCPECGAHHDRDENAARNILNKSVGVATELQTWRGCKTSRDFYFEAVPCEASMMK